MRPWPQLSGSSQDWQWDRGPSKADHQKISTETMVPAEQVIAGLVLGPWSQQVGHYGTATGIMVQRYEFQAGLTQCSESISSSF